ncbi:MAG: hypothetical protein RQ745_04410 [Longimicrobiales bacterium]|nr:hypothetical protein [Longimicrobiales bacterium]
MSTDHSNHDRPHRLTRKVAGVPLWVLLALAVAIPFLIGALIIARRADQIAPTETDASGIVEVLSPVSLV